MGSSTTSPKKKAISQLLRPLATANAVRLKADFPN